MNFLNPLLPLKQAYKTAHDSFTIAKRAIKTSEPQARQRLLQRTDLETTTISEAERVIVESYNEVNTLFVLALWATFERFLRDYLQYKGQALQQHLTPADFAQELYFHFHKEVEFWRPEEILEVLKLTLLKSQAHLAGEAKNIYNYRNWVAHGRNPHKTVSAIAPKVAYTTLANIVEILLANP
jgi:hypothetical protein